MNDGRLSYSPRCAVTNRDGKHCPKDPTVLAIVDGSLMRFCDQCYSNARDGHYGPKAITFIKTLRTQRQAVGLQEVKLEVYRQLVASMERLRTYQDEAAACGNMEAAAKRQIERRAFDKALGVALRAVELAFSTKQTTDEQTIPTPTA